MIYLLIAVGVLAASSAAVLIRLCDAPPLVIAAYRLGLAAAVVLPLAVARRRDELVSVVRGHSPALAASGLFLALHFALWIISLHRTSVASSVLLVTTSPIFVGLGGWLLLKEPLYRRTVIGIAISLVGTAIVTLNDWGIGHHAFTGDLLALGGALAITGHLLIGRRQRQRMTALTYVAVINTTAAVLLLLMAVVSGNRLTGYSAATYGFFALLAAGPQLTGHFIFNFALGRVPPVVIAIALLAEPIGSSVLAFLVLGEVPDPPLYLGAVVILAGIALAIWPGNHRARSGI